MKTPTPISNLRINTTKIHECTVFPLQNQLVCVDALNRVIQLYLLLRSEERVLKFGSNFVSIIGERDHGTHS